MQFDINQDILELQSIPYVCVLKARLQILQLKWHPDKVKSKKLHGDIEILKREFTSRFIRLEPAYEAQMKALNNTKHNRYIDKTTTQYNVTRNLIISAFFDHRMRKQNRTMADCIMSNIFIKSATVASQLYPQGGERHNKIANDIKTELTELLADVQKNTTSIVATLNEYYDTPKKIEEEETAFALHMKMYGNGEGDFHNEPTFKSNENKEFNFSRAGSLAKPAIVLAIVAAMLWLSMFIGVLAASIPLVAFSFLTIIPVVTCVIVLSYVDERREKRFKKLDECISVPCVNSIRQCNIEKERAAQESERGPAQEWNKFVLAIKPLEYGPQVSLYTIRPSSLLTTTTI